MTDPRRKSSQSWYMPTQDRRDLYVARNLPGAVELVRAHLAAAGVDYDTQGEEYRDRLEHGLRLMLAASFDEGAKHEEGLRTAVHTQRVIQHQLEALLRAHGLPVPTQRLGIDSEPPKKGGG
jgi:hypothetical protein